MNLIVKVVFDGKKFELPLTDSDSVSIGNYEFDSLIVPHKSFKKGHMIFSLDKSGKVFLLSKGKTYLDGQKFTEGYIRIGEKIAVFAGKHEILTAELCELRDQISVRINHEMTIGKKDVCSIVIMNPKVSRHHAAFYFSGKNVRIVDLNSSNGTYVNGQRITEAYLKNGDVISVVDYNFVYSDGFLSFDKREEIDCRTQNEPAMGKDYPMIHPSPRVKKDYKTGELQITNPPNIGSKPEINIVSLLTQPIAMIFVGLLISWASKSTSSMAMAYSLPMSVISVISSVITHLIARKKYKKKFELKIFKYTEYIKKVSQELRTAVQIQMKSMKDGAPETAECLTIVSDGKKEIWNRRNEDNDFLTFRIGSGKTESALKPKFQNNGFELQEDDLLAKIKSETEKYKIINGAPITVDFKKNSVMGVFGDRDQAKHLVKNMIIQATTFHTYNDLKIVALFPNSERDEWEWIKWLPHCFNEDRSRRYIACDCSSAHEIIKSVADILASKRVTTANNEYENEKQIKLPFYLFVIADEQIAASPLAQELISQCSFVYGVGAVIISDTFDALSRDTSVFVELSSEKNKLFTKNGENSTVYFETDILHNEEYERFSRTLAPLKLSDIKGAITLPKSITFLEGYGVRRPIELDLTSKWTRAKSYESLSVPIGVKSNGDLFMFDIHEKKHGTFGLIAGMAGSGKSEMLQSWILSMAVNFSPSEVNFVIIDFKGTGLITPFRKLPHLAGTISDIDKDISRNLVALKSEMERRKKLFDYCGAVDINDYAKKYLNGEVTEPLPITFIIIDEFAEFKIRYPDFAGEVVDSMMKTGRSLGIWPILSTQNPSGVVSDQSSANFRFKWCLKVAGPTYSSDMLGSGHTEAARITNPGRAYIKVGDYEVFEQIQSFWSGAPYNPTKNEKKDAVSQISLIGLDGSRKNLAVTEKTVGLRSYISEIDAVVNYIDAFVTENGIPRARKVWTPELPEKIYLPSLFSSSFDGSRWPETDNGLQVVIGLVDDPVSQSQYPLKLNLSGNGHTVIYGAPMTGKTNLMHTLIMSLCLSYSPDDVNIYGIDFGSLNMGMFKDYPHVGGVATGNEKEKADKLILLLESILNERKNRFGEAGVGNLIVYRRLTNEKMPFIVIAADNLSGFLSQNPNYQDFFVNLAEVGATYGIILVATASTANSISQRISNSIATKIVLRMTDDSSYTSILGNSARGVKPKDVAGRGLIKVNDVSLEYQTALPVEVNDEAEKVCEIKRISELMRNAWKGNLPQPIPIMPSVIAFGSVCSEGITLGLSTDEIKPIFFDYSLSHYMLISGTSLSGKTNVLKVIAKQFKNKYSSTVIVMDISGRWKEDSKICDRYITNVGAMDEFFEELAAELQRRKENQGQDITTPDCLLVVIDNFDRFIEEVSDETAKRLNAFMRIGKNLNVFLVAAGDNRKLADRNNKGDGITASLSNGRFKVMLGDCYNSHIAFDTDLNLSQRNEELESFEGLFFNGKKTTKFKAMKE
ncbi:MAG: type VII secretion protein EssC [Clostridia bacterium]|nr:type VII secretion protein EssC [Clostridia bacterium]